MTSGFIRSQDRKTAIFAASRTNTIFASVRVFVLEQGVFMQLLGPNRRLDGVFQWGIFKLAGCL